MPEDVVGDRKGDGWDGVGRAGAVEHVPIEIALGVDAFAGGPSVRCQEGIRT